MEPNFYEILGLLSSASEEEIKIAYKKLAKKYHPDKHAGQKFYEEHFKKINAAYQTLSNAEKRKRYDFKLAYQVQKKDSAVQNTRAVQKKPTNYRQKEQYRKKDPAQNKKLRKYAIISVSALILFIGGTVKFYFYMNSVAAKHHLEEGKKQEAKGFYIFALEEYAAAISFDKKLYEAYERRADLRIRLFRDYLGASEDYSRALQKEDPEAGLYFKRAKAYLKSKEYEKGLTDLDSAIKKSPLYDSLYFYRAEVNHFVTQDHRKAIADYSKVITISKKFHDGWLGRALSYQDIGEHEEAISDFNQCLELRPEDGSIYYYRAFSHLSRKDSSSACSDFFEAERNNFTEARSALNNYCIKQF